LSAEAQQAKAEATQQSRNCRTRAIWIVEENESFAAKTGYVNELRAVVNRP